MGFNKRWNNNREFLKDNFWLFLGFFLHGSFGYAYHFFMGRFLGPEDYGILGAILSITYLITVFIQVIQLTSTKIVSKLKVQQKFLRINYFFRKSLKKMFVYGCILSLVLLVSSPFLASFLKIKDLHLISILGLFIIITFLLATTRGVLQGLQMFKVLAMNYITEGFVKLVFGAGLVLLGYGVGGAIGGIIMSFFVAFVFALLPMNLSKKIEKFNFKSFYPTSFKILIVLASLTFVYSIDVILVKHFFNAVEAGYYAALSTLGKIIFFASSSVSYVMFSKISGYEKADKTKALFYKSIILVSLISALLLFVYFIFPGFSVELLFGPTFLSIKNYLGLFGIFMFLFSLVYTISFYNLSINKKKFIYALLIFNLLEVILICLFHDSIIQIIYILIFLVLILLVVLLILTGVFEHRTITNNSSV